MASIEVDGRPLEVPDGSSIRDVLESLGMEINMFPSENGIFMPCQTGGCWSCAVEINGRLQPACVSNVQQGMKIHTDTGKLTPIRVVGGFMGHRVGGVGTPWWLKGDYIEVACFAAGCNFCCPQCQNWPSANLCAGDPLTPKAAAEAMTATRRRFGVNRLAISGGECTLNRRWLVQYIDHLKDLNPGARLHVDTNGSILTEDYIDELVMAGMTDIGIDLKALQASTFMRITGLVDEPLAARYMETAWKAIEHLRHNHPRIFLGIGIPYNRELISPEEIAEMGGKIAEIDPWIQVCALDYRPEFRRPDLVRPGFEEMQRIHEILRGSGLESVICQTEEGRIGPDGERLGQ